MDRATTPLSNQSRQRISFVLVVLLMVLASAWIGRGVYRLRYLQMDMDEALHANRGLDFTSAFIRADWEDIKLSLVKPDYYPPGHGVMLGAWLYFLRGGIVSVRLYSTLCYFLFGVLLWFSIRELLPDVDPLLYLVPPLFLIADASHTVVAGLSMLELPAILFATLALYFLNRACRTKRLVDYTLSLAFGVICLFVKYNYGLVVFAVFGIRHAMIILDWFRFRRSDRSAYCQIIYILIFWGSVISVAAIWFVWLNEWQWLFAYASAQPAQYDLWSNANLTYYLRMLWTNSLSWLALLLTLGGFILQVRKRRFLKGFMPYLAFFVISFVVLTLEQQNSSRFGMMLTPSLWIMAGVGVDLLLIDRLPRSVQTSAIISLCFGMFLAGVINFYNFQSRLFMQYENTNSGVDQAYQFIADVIDVADQEKVQVVMLGRTDQWNGLALRFSLETKCMFNDTGCWIAVHDNWDLRKGWPPQDFSEDEQAERVQAALTDADYLVHFYRRREPPEGWTLVSEHQFEFERNKKKPVTIWVSIYRP